MIFQGIWTRTAKKPYIFVTFQGGPDPCPPSGSAHVMLMVCVISCLRCSTMIFFCKFQMSLIRLINKMSRHELILCQETIVLHLKKSSLIYANLRVWMGYND